MRRLFFLGYLILALMTTACSELTSGESTSDSGGGSSPCDNSGITSYTYLMAFHACSTDCTTPANHTIYLAGSDNGIDWTQISSFSAIAGSVPDLLFVNDFLYIFHTGVNRLAKVNACFQVVSESDVTLNGSTDSGGFVDPSLIVEGDRILLFYLPGAIGSDPAGCSSYPCTKEIHSAENADDTLTSFNQSDTARISQTVTGGTFSDPDIVARADGTYLLYVSAGQSTYVYTGSNLDGTFTSPDGSTTRAISNNTGGVPSAIEVNSEIWLYVTANEGGQEVIRRAVSSDGLSLLTSSDFSTVIDDTVSSSFPAGTNTSSPSIVRWPGSSWSRTP